MMFSRKKKSKQDDAFDTLETLDIGPEDDSFSDSETDGKKAKKKLPAWVIIPVIVVLAGGAFGLSVLTGGSDNSSGGTALQVTEVTRGSVEEVYNATGTIESENTKTYYSPVTAPIKECNAVVGQPVKKGDLLISFDTTNLERDNQQAQLNLQSSLNSSRAAKAQNAQAIEAANAASAQAAEQANALAEEVNTLAAQVDAANAQYQANLEAAGQQAQANETLRQQLETTITENEKIITANQSLIDSTDAGYAGKRADYDAAVALPEDQRTEEQKNLIRVFEAYDAAVAARDAAQAAVNDAQKQLDAIQDPDVDDAGCAELKAQYDAKYAEWQAAYQAAGAPSSATGMTDAEFDNLAISDNLAELAALTPEELLEKGKEGMKADMDGVIASVDPLQTNTAAQGAALFTIASTEKTRVKIEISPDDYADMKIGATAQITVGDNTYEGTLTNVDKIAVQDANGSPVIGAQIHINNPDENICIGATAKIRMTVSEANNVLVVPTEVVNASTDGDFVYIIEDGVVKERPVTLGTASATQVEIVEGLEEGDMVVNDMSADIQEGMRAVAQPDTSSQASE